MHRAKSLITVGVSVAIAGSVMFAATPATASPTHVQSSDIATNSAPPDQVIDRTSERMPVDATAMNTLQARQPAASASQQVVSANMPIPLPAGVVLRTGRRSR